jgi:putative oxidoreductase
MKVDVGLFLLRLGVGATFATHGLAKLQKWGELAAVFPDPIGVGHSFSLALAIFGELVCGALLAAGLATRVAAVPALVTMLVALGVIHAADPFQKKELAFIYAVCFLTLLLTGPGRLSLDAVIGARRKLNHYRP